MARRRDLIAEAFEARGWKTVSLDETQRVYANEALNAIITNRFRPLSPVLLEMRGRPTAQFHNVGSAMDAAEKPWVDDS